jgi:glycosyltransferase involved in cell wall biosynthesis
VVGKMVSWIDLRMSDLSDKLIVVSQDIKDKLLKRISIDETKVTVIRNGVRTSGVRLKYEECKKAIEGLGCQTGDKIVGAVGRLTEEKNHAMLLMAAQVVITKHPNAKFLIVGDGPLREELENLAAELLISDNTIFTGWRDDVNTLYQVMDLVVFPSLTEGLPISLLEAMSHGKVVLATRVGGIPEVIHHGKNGVLIDENDPEYLAEGITYILKNASKVQEMGRRASELIEKELSIGRMAEETRMVYREVLGC